MKLPVCMVCPECTLSVHRVLSGGLQWSILFQKEDLVRNPTVRVHGVDIGEEFIMAGRSEFSGCSLCMMGGCVCQKMVYVPQGKGLGGGLLP